jgi:hypothetical protein
MFPEYIAEIRKGKKTSTIRPGVKAFNPGLLVLSSDKEMTTVRVLETTHKKFSELNDDDAQREGMESAAVLRKSLKCIYPRLNPNSTVTVIRFEPLCGFSSNGS